MSAQQPGAVRRFFRGIWRTVDFTRRLVFNLIFLVVVFFVLAAMLASRPTLRAKTALVIDPRGDIVEQYTIDAGQRALSGFTGEDSRQTQLRDLLRAIDLAANDAHIERIVLVPDHIDSAGLSLLREVGAALDRFRASGKEVVAVSGGMSQSQYFLAAHADRILLDPEGAVLLEGFASYRSYFKDALDKLGVQVHLIKVGQFKSAAEPFILNQASDASKEADRYWMGGIWQEYLDEIAALRKVDAGALADGIAHADERVAATNGDLAKVALDEKLVDQLATRPEARAYLRERGAPEDSDDDETFRQVDFKTYLAMAGRDGMPDVRPHVAVIVAQGEIVPGEQPAGLIGGDSTARLVRQAREDDHVKAIVLRVDSPGGDAYSSEIIRREIELTKAQGKPVIVSMGNVAASGGYWISMDADEIWAQPTTITGSIGIFGLFVTVPDALAKIGIHTDGIATTPLAGSLDVRRPLSPQIETILTQVIRRGYTSFITHVAKARNRKPEEIDAIAQGRVWSGVQAKERGLVDKLGGLQEATAAAAARAKLGDNYQVRYVERTLSAWERFALSFGEGESFARIARYAGFALPAAVLPPSEVRQALAVVDTLRGKSYGVFAHCFCEIR